MHDTLPKGSEAPARPGGAEGPPPNRLWWRLIWWVIAASSALRLWLAIDDHGIYWPDEIYQSVEQAHRLAFGHGIIPWEFRDGARSWLFPGLIAALWRVAAALGVHSSLVLVALARGCMVFASGAAMWWSARLSERLASARAGLVAALVLAVLPMSVVFGFRTLSETASAPLVVLAAACVLDGSPRGSVRGGVWASLAALLRYQNALFGISFVLWLLLQRRRRDALLFLAAAFGVGVAGGLLDWLTWGRPFHSLILYLDFNLIRGGASTFGVEPFWYYARSLWDSTGPSLLVFALFGTLGALRAPAIALAAGLYLFFHSVIPHKELRFVLPCLPLAAVLVGLGADDVYRRLGRQTVLLSIALGALLLACVLRLPVLTYGRLGQYLGTPRAEQRIWHADEDVNLLLADAGQAPDLCGLGVLGLRPAFTGGYTYLHRPVPLVYTTELCGAAPALNYLLRAKNDPRTPLPAGYELLRERGELGLYRRSGGCAALPGGFDPLLDGARDMGLHRPLAEQGPEGGVHFDLRSASGSFTQGWGHGEIADCKPARWAVGRHSRVDFDALTPNTNLYVLRARVRAFADTPRQKLRLSLNGQVLDERELTLVPQTLVLDVPAEALKRGLNHLDFEFSETWRPGGDDTRDLAALLQRLELTPLTDDFDVDLDTPDAADHLISGFGQIEGSDGAHFVWSDGPASVMEGRLGEPLGPGLLSLSAAAIAEAAPERMRIVINDALLTQLEIGQEPLQREFVVSPELLRRGKNQVRFEYEKTLVPAEVNPSSTDHRQLAIRFDQVQLERLPQISTIDLGTSDAEPALLDGWSPGEREAERSVVWSVGPRARLRVALGGSHDARLQIDARAYTPALPLEVEVRLNDTAVGTFSPTVHWHGYELTLPARLFSMSDNVIEFRFDHAARPSQHEPGSTDERELALRFDRVKIVRW